MKTKCKYYVEGFCKYYFTICFKCILFKLKIQDDDTKRHTLQS